MASAIIFYNVYECGSKDSETASKDVDTSKAGANVIIADGTENNINGSYVAKIYKSVTLSEDGTEVTDSKKLHKYDGAFYSKMSMNVSDGEEPMIRPDFADGQNPPDRSKDTSSVNAEISSTFTIQDGENYFASIAPAESASTATTEP